MDHAPVATGFEYSATTRRALGLLARVAAGRLDGFFESPLRRWDRAAGSPLVTQAGGIVSALRPPAGTGGGVLAVGPLCTRRSVTGSPPPHSAWMR